MQSVARWGNSLAVRLPAHLVRSMGLKEGDKVELANSVADRIEIVLVAEMTKSEALAEIAKFRWTLPEGYKFDREEANSRFHD